MEMARSIMKVSCVRQVLHALELGGSQGFSLWWTQLHISWQSLYR